MSGIYFATHTGALLLVLMLPIEPWQKVILALLIGVSGWWQVRYGTGMRAVQIRLGEMDTCALSLDNGQHHYRILHAGIYPGFVRLSMRGVNGQSRIQLVPRDCVDLETYRALRAWIVQRRV